MWQEQDLGGWGRVEFQLGHLLGSLGRHLTSLGFSVLNHEVELKMPAL